MNLRKIVLLLAAAAAAGLGFATPSFAGDGYGRGYGYRPYGVHVKYHRGYYPRRYYGGRGYYGPRRRYYRGGRYYHGHGGSADAALIALGAIGGAIIIGEIIKEDRRRDEARERRYRRAYDPRYDEYYYRRGEPHGRYAYPDDDAYINDDGSYREPRYDDRREAEPPRREDPARQGAPRRENRAPVKREFEDPPVFEEPEAVEPQFREPEPQRAPERAPRPAPSAPVERDDLGDDFDDELEDDLLGGPDDREFLEREEENRNERRDDREDARGEIITIAVDAAFRDCAAEARQAARREGAILAMPARPTYVEAVGPDLVRMTADLTASDRGGRNAMRRLTCEANVDRITFLELS